MIRNAESETIDGKQGVLNRWKKYFNELLNEDKEKTPECDKIYTACQLISPTSKEKAL